MNQRHHGDAQRQLVLQQHPVAALQCREHTARFAVAVAGPHTNEAERLQVLMASEPPWFLGMMWSTSRARWFSWVPQHPQRPRAHR